MLHGLCIFYNEKGEMICECVYENGIRNGWIREYNNNQTVSMGICKNGEKVSTLLLTEEIEVFLKKFRIMKE